MEWGKNFMQGPAQPKRINPRYQERNQKIKELYLSGLTLRAIGAKVELTFERVRQVLNEMGVEKRSRVRPRTLCICGCGELASRYCRYVKGHQRRKPEVASRVVELYDSGLSMAEVAREVGYAHASSVQYHLNKQGHKTRSISESKLLFRR